MRVEQRQIAGRRTRREVGLEPVVTATIHDEPEAARSHRLQLPEPAAARPAHRIDPEAAFDGGQQCEARRQAAGAEDVAQMRQVRSAPRERMHGVAPQRPLRAQAVLPHVDDRVREAGEVHPGRRPLRWRRSHRDVDPDGRGAGREKEQKEGRWTQTHAAAKAIALPVASAAGWTDDLVSAPTE